MKAVVTKTYGFVGVLEIEETSIPQINEDEILVEVRAASINPLDVRIRDGEFKMMTGKKPPRILGVDYAGVVSAVGENVSIFQVGDEVFGMLDGFKTKEGSYAQYLKAKAEDMTFKPNNLSFEEAASLPLVALTAYQALVELGDIAKGEHILINGATGGVGSVAVQIAKALGCHVTATCSQQNLSFATALGADRVIDYAQEDVYSSPIPYDVIFDTVGNLDFGRCKTILNPEGLYVTTDAPVSLIILTPLANLLRRKKMKIVLSKPNGSMLSVIRDMIEEGEINAHIFKRFVMEEIHEAHLLMEKGGFRGKLVLTMGGV